MTVADNNHFRPRDRQTGSAQAWLWPLAVLVTAVVGSLGSQAAPTVYRALERPEWAPSAAVFGPVWTVLYISMAVAAFWVARQPASGGADEERQRRLGLRCFGLALLPNALWSWCFFAWQRADWAMLSILALLVLLGVAIYSFGRVHRAAAWLLTPLLAWVSFAAVLNADLLMRNGSRLIGY